MADSSDELLYSLALLFEGIRSLVIPFAAVRERIVPGALTGGSGVKTDI